MQLLIFNLGNELFAIDTAKIQSINEPMPVKKVPLAPPYILGLINLRGNIISIIDINLLLGIPETGNLKENVIILELKDEVLGMMVDYAAEIIETENALQPELPDCKRDGYVEGVVRFEGRAALLIDVEKLLEENNGGKG
ncbi:MAG: chemotaxis protein CheW [Clostridiaceae bacterium]